MDTIGLGRTIDNVTLGALLLAVTCLLGQRIRVRVRVPGPRPGGPRSLRIVRLASTSVGLLVALASPAGAAGKRNGSPLPVPPRSPEPPWSETGGFSSPSRPPVGTGATDVDRGSGTDASPPWRGAPVTAHPAVHSNQPRSERITPLFPRHSPTRRVASTDVGEVERSRRERAQSMRMHPAGRARTEGSGLPTLHRVVSGDSLWTIAEEVLRTDDPVRIARYWHKIHRANREVIGRDPNVLVPGQQLTLPAESL